MRFDHVDDLRGALPTEIWAELERLYAVERAAEKMADAFRQHRTTTHLVRAKYCDTCQKGAAILAEYRALVTRPAEEEGA